ncbi:unnamed protein product [Urochloa decumbens]|uniref:SOSEKI DIX-like domain-containing protein n=1 Tax=Urochloa decumbens TaxID=240449 RepID=A0ABC8VKN4_9POAL
MATSSSFQRQRGEERRGRWGSPERTVVWTEPKHYAPNKPPTATRKVAVVYYLCHRDGHLDHPHFLEMKLLPGAGLYLRDFTARLDVLRGSGMPAMYAWSSKRSYRNGYVWQDLADDDLVHPAHGADEYVLKGSPLLIFPDLPPAPPHAVNDDASSSGSGRAAAARRHKNWSSFDLGEYSNSKLAAQNDRRRAPDLQLQEEESTELAVGEISPPPSSGSPDDAREREVGVIAGGRMRASAVLMQLFSCGSMGTGRRGRSDLPASADGGSSRRAAAEKEADAYATPARAECLSGGGGVGIMDRDYFSGSLVEKSSSKTAADGGNAALLLKRSSSCNADRGAARMKMKMPVAAREQVVRAGCLASRGSRAGTKKNQSKSTAAESRVDGGESKGATTEPAAAADGAGSS